MQRMDVKFHQLHFKIPQRYEREETLPDMIPAGVDSNGLYLQ